jgi:hypothetical protein
VILTFAKRIKLRVSNCFFVEGLNIRIRSFSGQPPILIYQMGKVGSATVHETLVHANLSQPVYHVHFLSYDGIKNAEEFFRNLRNPINPGHLRRSKVLRQIIDRNGRKKWKVITLVREPIGRDISDFFQTLDRYHPELVENGEIKTSEVSELLVKNFSSYDPNADYTSTWLDKELKNVFGVDVYAQRFDVERGYSIIRDRGKADVLILRLEDLNANLEKSLVEFLDVSNPIKMMKSNIGIDKKYSVAYRDVLEEIRISEACCRKIYSSRYAQQFYDEKMLSEFTKRWSKGKG